MPWDQIATFLTNNQLFNIPKGLLFALIGSCLTVYYWCTADDPGAKFLSGWPPVLVIVGLCIAFVCWISDIHQRRKAKREVKSKREAAIALYDKPGLDNFNSLENIDAIMTLLYLFRFRNRRFSVGNPSSGLYALINSHIAVSSKVEDGVISGHTYDINRKVWEQREAFIALHDDKTLEEGFDYTCSGNRFRGGGRR